MMSSPLRLMIALASAASLHTTSGFIGVSNSRPGIPILTAAELADPNAVLQEDAPLPFTSEVNTLEPQASDINPETSPDPLTSMELAATEVVLPPTKSHHALSHKRWGVDNNKEEEYWFDSRIHTLGNHGFMGAVHAACAPLATKLIDLKAYDGIDVRHQVAKELAKTVDTAKARVLDLCCGVGFSTKALTEAFPHAEEIIGIDTSPQMVAMAEFIASHLSTVSPLTRMLSTTYTTMKEQGNKMQRTMRCYKDAIFAQGNAENTELPDQSFDLITIMYAFHETPMDGRNKILQEARRLLQPDGKLAVVDICTTYEPSASMLMGEPYVREYQENIHRQLGEIDGFSRTEYKTLVPGHVGMWLLQKEGSSERAFAALRGAGL